MGLFLLRFAWLQSLLVFSAWNLHNFWRITLYHFYFGIDDKVATFSGSLCRPLLVPSQDSRTACSNFLYAFQDGLCLGQIDVNRVHCYFPLA